MKEVVVEILVDVQHEVEVDFVLVHYFGYPYVYLRDNLVVAVVGYYCLAGVAWDCYCVLIVDLVALDLLGGFVGEEGDTFAISILGKNGSIHKVISANMMECNEEW